MSSVAKIKTIYWFLFFLAIALLVSYNMFGFSLNSIFLFISLVLLAWASRDDLLSQEIDWRILVLGLASGLGLYFKIQGYNVVGIALSIASAGIIPLVLVLLSKQLWMGWGDVLMAAWVGLICGVPRSLLAVFFAFLGGALFGIIMLVQGKRQKTLAFGPFLFAGCCLALVFGGEIIAWYLTII